MKTKEIEIMIAKNAGLCFGVKRAINMALDASKKSKKTVFTLGPIIHNPQVVEFLKTKKIIPIDNINKIEDNTTIVVRSHGIAKQKLDFLKSKKITIIDATCPFVKKSQQIAKDLAHKNTDTLIIGDKDHPEVIALKSYSKKNSIVINSLNDLNLKTFKLKNLAIICQTTKPIEVLNEINTYLNKHNVKTKVFNTICDATIKRQNEARELSKKVDTVLVIGGKNSANTKRLYDICSKLEKNTLYLETEYDLKKSHIKNSNKIGIITGASTPDWIIEKIKSKLRRLINNE